MSYDQDQNNSQQTSEFLSSSGLKLKMRNRKIIVLFQNQNICCGYSKEPSQWDGSFEHPKHMLKIMGKKTFTILRWKFFAYLNLCFYRITTTPIRAISFQGVSQLIYLILNSQLQESTLFKINPAGNIRVTKEMDYEDPDERLFNLFIRAMESETNLYSDVQVSNCKFWNFRANFIFRPICDIKNLRLGHDLPLSVNDRVISLFCEGFIFHETSHIYILFI